MLTDDILQQELSAAFHQEADPVAWMTSSPAALFRQAKRHRRRQVVTRTGALAAAVAVAALAAGALSPAPAPARAPTATSATGRHHTGPATATGRTGVLLAAAVTTAPPAAVAASGMPSFYVVANHGQPAVDIRAAATGSLLSTVALPAGTDPKLVQVTASGDDRTFVLAMFSVSGGTQFYELKVTASGQSAGLVRLAVPLPSQQMVQAIALTPDGTRLAVASQDDGKQGTIEVVSLANGAARTWTSSAVGLPWDLSWDASGRQLAYFWSGGTSQSGGLWLLDTDASRNALLSGRRLLPETVGPDDVQDAILTPDGQAIIASVTYESLAHVDPGAVVGGIVALSAQTGLPLHTLLAVRATSSPVARAVVTSCLLSSIDATGDHLLVSCDQFGRLDRGRFTALPGADPNMVVSAAAW